MASKLFLALVAFTCFLACFAQFSAAQYFNYDPLDIDDDEVPIQKRFVQIPLDNPKPKGNPLREMLAQLDIGTGSGSEEESEPVVKVQLPQPVQKSGKPVRRHEMQLPPQPLPPIDRRAGLVDENSPTKNINQSQNQYRPPTMHQLQQQQSQQQKQQQQPQKDEQHEQSQQQQTLSQQAQAQPQPTQPPQTPPQQQAQPKPTQPQQTLPQQQTQPQQERPQLTQPQQRLNLEPHSQETLNMQPHSQQTLNSQPHSQLNLQPHSRETLNLQPHSRETLNLQPHSQETLNLPPHSQEMLTLQPRQPQQTLPQHPQPNPQQQQHIFQQQLQQQQQIFQQQQRQLQQQQLQLHQQHLQQQHQQTPVPRMLFGSGEIGIHENREPSPVPVQMMEIPGIPLGSQEYMNGNKEQYDNAQLKENLRSLLEMLERSSGVVTSAAELAGSSTALLKNVITSMIQGAQQLNLQIDTMQRLSNDLGKEISKPLGGVQPLIENQLTVVTEMTKHVEEMLADVNQVRTSFNGLIYFVPYVLGVIAGTFVMCILLIILVCCSLRKRKSKTVHGVKGEWSMQPTRHHSGSNPRKI